MGHLSMRSVILALVVVTGEIVACSGARVAAGDPSFRNDVMAVLSRSGCSLGTCHGNQNGKGGLKLSLRGQDPEGDFLTLTRSLGARRVNVQSPDESLLLLKPLMAVPHEGGQRFRRGSAEHEVLRAWIAAGMPADEESAPSLKRLFVEPESVTLYAPQSAVELRARAEYTDGTIRDVGERAVFESSNPSVPVTSAGEVQFPESRSARQTSVTVRYLSQQVVSRVDYVPSSAGFEFSAPAPANGIDELVFARLQRLRINPAEVCDDVTFVRRVYLDVTGLLPTAAQSREFVESREENKRSVLIDRLLESEEYVDFQSLRWADLLRVEDKTLDAKGVEVFYQWIRESVSADKPLNQFAAELVGSRGSTYSEPPANFYRALRTPEERAEAAAQLFLGVRLQCARCHNHPFDYWTQDDYYGWTGFFARVGYKILENRRRDTNDTHEFDGEQIVYMQSKGEVKNPSTGRVVELRFPGGGSGLQAGVAGRDRLQVLSQWMASPDNLRFASTQANRIWAQVYGQGIVDPIDDFRATNPASNPELLEWITREFVAGGYRVRPLLRLILNSRTWQLSSQSNATNAEDATLFSHVTPRRLTAEQMLDGMSQVLETPVRYGGYPTGTRAVQLAGVRNGGHRYSRPEAGDRFLSLFGKPGRLLTCECERAAETTLAQTMEMVGGNVVSEVMQGAGGRIERALRSGETTEAFLEDFWWSALSRRISNEELRELSEYVSASEDHRKALEDVVWAVLNSNEFLLRR